MSNTADRRRHALIIGIDEYPNFLESMQLQGCVNDAKLMATLLEGHFGFPGKNITTLHNARATREGILESMTSLRERIQEGDVVVIHFSGHGSRRWSREGNKPDGRDQTIVPFDSGRSPHDNLEIADNDIYYWLLDLSTVTSAITLIFDSCYAGGITRDSFGASVRQLPEDLRPASEMPPSPFQPKGARGSSREVGPSGWLPPSERYVLLAGCRHDEQSCELRPEKHVEVTPEPQGALTFFLHQELLKAGSGATYRDVFERASTRITALFPSQNPQLEGARDRLLFGVKQRRPMRFLPVRDRTDNRVVLGGGAAHGLTVGSEWTIHPPETKRMNEGTRLGRVRIAEVRTASATAEIVEGDQRGGITAGCRAVEHAHCYGEMRLAVEVGRGGQADKSVEPLRREIASSALLRLTREAERGSMRVYLVGPRRQVSTADPVPQLGALEESLWAVVGPDGGLAMPSVPAAEPGAMKRLLTNLESRSRYRHGLELENHDPRNALNGKVKVQLWRRRGDGEWAVAEPESAQGRIVFAEGDHFGLEIIHHHQAAVYLAVLDFGLTGRVSLLYPVAGAQEALIPERPLRIGMREGEKLELFIPQNFPFTGAAAGEAAGEAAGGVACMKIFVTTCPADFSVLTQGGYRRSTPLPPHCLQSALGDVLRTIWLGEEARGPGLVHHRTGEHWTAVMVSFFLRFARGGA